MGVMSFLSPRITPAALVLAAAVISAPVAAQPLGTAGTPLQTPVVSASPAPRSAASLPVLGAMLALGAPDGASASVVYRPTSFLRAEVGGAYNLISKGARAGVSLIPFGAGPSATLEAGRFFEGDANGIARQIAGSSFGDNAVLQRLGYDFVNAHLGLEFGSRWVTFFVHGGMSYIRGSVHNLNDQLSADASATSTTTVTFKQDPTVRIFTPSAKLGLVFYIW